MTSHDDEMKFWLTIFYKSLELVAEKENCLRASARALCRPLCLTTYHLTFAPLGGKTHSKEKPTGVIWYDEISGRKDEDVTSGYIKLLKSLRDVRDVLISADNCSSQNKCWILHTALVFYPNSPGFYY